MTDPEPGVSAVPKSETPNPKSTDYRVQLDAYAGPLDLLLYLVKRHEIDLQDIPIAQLTEQYLEHLRVIQAVPGAMDVDRAGEFLVMAATLVEIKSALLMPQVQAETEEGEDPTEEANVDPRFELVQQLLAYKRYKDASMALDQRRSEWDVRFPAVAKTPKPPAASPEDEAEDSAKPVDLDLEDVNVMDLCAAFGRMLDAIGFTGDHEVTYDDTPISLHADDIADRLERDGGTDGMTLREIFVGRKSRSEMIGLFLATLELVRQRRVQVVQADFGGDIKLQLRPESDRNDLDDRDDQASTDWRNPETGEIEYEWPDEASRLRAEKRAKIRATYAAKGQSPPDDADDIGDVPTPGKQADPGNEPDAEELDD
ncbi:segregation and condensation protein A [Algisphaera agarilytica]|uniref:Segregation and condensation protein A n=1 Tax=Algisphaera agarilytica TaxID=1385975 RepID=A0A7X0LKF6_9BACT|nr:segregation/condensation protein A [Algisphaera agarilytica]MBB6430380.1 segregation and condensation protein A [Algisphaera agarilytica]